MFDTRQANTLREYQPTHGKTFMAGFTASSCAPLSTPRGELLRIKPIPGNTDDRKPVPLTAFEKTLLPHRDRVRRTEEPVPDRTHPPSSNNFIVNLMAGIVAYCLSGNKPTLPLIRVNALATA